MCNVIVIGSKRVLEEASTKVLLIEPPHPSIIDDARSVLTFPHMYDVATQDEGCACGFQLVFEASYFDLQSMPPDEVAEIEANDRAMLARREELIEFLRSEVDATGELELFVTIYDPDNHLLKHDPMPQRTVSASDLEAEQLQGPLVLTIHRSERES